MTNLQVGDDGGMYHALNAGEALCEDYTADDLALVAGMSWSETVGRRCPGCDVLASATGAG